MHLNQEGRRALSPRKPPGRLATKQQMASHGNAGTCRRRKVQVRYPFTVTLTVNFDREEDGRWIALVESIPGCQVYGETREEALTKVEALALHAIAEKLEDGEVTAEEATNVSFVVSAAA
jgi:predicted RNase H-like HicB family nuclease